VHRAFALVLAIVCVWGQILILARLQESRSDPQRSFSIAHYDVQLEPRLDSRTVTGTVTLSVASQSDDVAPAGATIALNRGRLEIDSVQEDGRDRAFVIDGNQLRITLPRGRANAIRAVAVRYHGAPSSGLVFSAEREQIYTIFSTSQWMVALDEPSARATLRLRVTMPRAWTGAGSGREVVRRDLPGDRVLMEWELDRPVPTYTFGFVIGAFAEVGDSVVRCISRTSHR
jgi:aminopeptidase N